MSYEQLKPFYPKDMGNKKGWCLQNCRLGFHIYTGKYASAKSAMQAGKKNGTYHDGMPPNNIAVPVYISTSSSNGHVVVYDKGTWYEDGKKKSKMTNILGWDEMMDGVRVVQVAKTKSFLPAKGYWGPGDKDARIADLALFMRQNFPSYTSAKALGSYYGDYLTKSIKEFQKRTGLYTDGCTGPKTYNKLKAYGFVY